MNMAESQELQNTLAAILANIQKLSEENKVGRDEAAKQNNRYNHFMMRIKK